MKYNKAYVESHSELPVIQFWKPQYKNGIFSQWYLSDFTEDGVSYSCAEQYMMAQKALLFNDIDTFDDIMNDSNPANMKKYGRLVRNFNERIWNEHKTDIVRQANILKFSQNGFLKKQLLNTGNSILVEASPYDRIWGIGSDDYHKWNGENLLGFCLMEVRDILKMDNNDQ